MAGVGRGWPIAGAGLTWRGPVCAALVACARGDGHALSGLDAGGDATRVASADSGTSHGARASTPGGAASVGAVARAGALSVDGGPNGCRLLGGPFELPGGGLPALVVRGDDMLAVLNEDGHPRIIKFRAGPWAMGAQTNGPAPATPAPPRALTVPCSVAADEVFCPDRGGAVYRYPLGGGDRRWVANSRPGTRIATATVTDSVTVLAYLASRKTTEGWVTEAWVAIDGDGPERLSEDGSGATSVVLAVRGGSSLALTVDARAALTPMHAREVRYDHGLRLGDDVVIFVGGPGDPSSTAALAVFPSGLVWGLLPIARDATSFGVATVRIDRPPQVDEPLVWSMYPDGLDPAPLATANTPGRTWVARVRPKGAGPRAPRTLEIGELSDSGTFDEAYVVPGAEAVTDVALATDGRGALWVGWREGPRTWLERIACS